MATDEGPVLVEDAAGDVFGHGTAVAHLVHELAPDAELGSFQVLHSGEYGCSGTASILETAVLAAIDKARGLDLRAMRHPYGDGKTGERIAAVLASINAADGVWVRKRNSY
jgi:hypothetical protein